MLCLLIFALLVCCSGYIFQFEEGETRRFIYKGASGHHHYCTVCTTGKNDEQNRETQQGECIVKNFKPEIPEPKPICKESVPDGIIPGCGPLPVLEGLFWKTKSGRPIQNRSTVYEEYFPQCLRTRMLESNFSSIRCGENLKWNVNPTNFRCLKGCGPLPNQFEWKLENGGRTGNESLAGYTYIGFCRPEFKTSITVHCGRNSIWYDDPSQAVCPSEDCDEWYCIVEIQIILALVMLLIPLIIVSLYCARVRKKHAKRSLQIESRLDSELEMERPMIGISDKLERDGHPKLASDDSDNKSGDESAETTSTNPDLPGSEGTCNADSTYTNQDLSSSEGNRTPVEHSENPFFKQDENIKVDQTLQTGVDQEEILEFTVQRDENIKVFQTLQTGVNQDGILEFTVQMGELVYIATKETMTDVNSLQIKRKDQADYRGVVVYPFLHCIKEIESVDDGIYYWTTTESWPKRNVFLLSVKDRGQPDGLESISSRCRLRSQVSCEVQQEVLDYCSSILKSCLATPPSSSISTITDVSVCTLKIDTIFRNMEDFLKQLCYCLDNSTSYQLRGCWRVIAKTFLNRTDAYISSVEWHRKGDPDNGPSNLILNDLRRANPNLTIGQLVANLPPNLDLLNTILRFHNDCYFCNRLFHATQQTEPKVFCNA
ncbi:uncharacterized protein LOC134242452 [Saccostrea cucullata]|uniref:uncharacterized protein LOC134242452 n=1 Tax=Saccostrea cuccullata TaxID=36930 RepID=UPI002ED26C79